MAPLSGQPSNNNGNVNSGSTSAGHWPPRQQERLRLPSAQSVSAERNRLLETAAAIASIAETTAAPSPSPSQRSKRTAPPPPPRTGAGKTMLPPLSSPAAVPAIDTPTATDTKAATATSAARVPKVAVVQETKSPLRETSTLAPFECLPPPLPNTDSKHTLPPFEYTLTNFPFCSKVSPQHQSAEIATESRPSTNGSTSSSTNGTTVQTATSARRTSARLKMSLVNNIKSEKPSKMGRKGDPRMHRAVAERLNNPELTLLEALRLGGFDFPSDGGHDATLEDADGVTLGQRKNQLSRRLRLARQNAERNTNSKPVLQVAGQAATQTSAPPMQLGSVGTFCSALCVYHVIRCCVVVGRILPITHFHKYFQFLP